MAMRAPRALHGALNVELSYRWKKLPTPMRGHFVGVWAALHLDVVFDGSAVTAAGDAVPPSARAHDVVLVVCSRELHVLAARVSVLFTVTFHANLAHNLTRSP
jgi:hypothetical protein